MNLPSLRKSIDRLDAQLVRLLNERTRIAREIGRVKHANGDAVYAPEREQDVLARVVAHSGGPLQPAALQSIYREIMSAALAMECQLVVGVAQDSRGETAVAARGHFGGSVTYRHFASAAALLQAARTGRVDLAFLPGDEVMRAVAGPLARAFAAGQLAVCASVKGRKTFFVVGRQRPPGGAGHSRLCAWIGRQRRGGVRLDVPKGWRVGPVLKVGLTAVWPLIGPDGASIDEVTARLARTMGEGRLLELGSSPPGRA